MKLHSVVIDQWFRRALPTYWLFLFCVTHVPRLEIPTDVPERDKAAHFVAYAILTYLLWRFAATFRPPARRLSFGAAAVLLLYAGFDEFLQQFVGRSADVVDWMMDAVGIIGTLMALEWWRRRPTRTHRSVVAPPSR